MLLLEMPLLPLPLLLLPPLPLLLLDLPEKLALEPGMEHVCAGGAWPRCNGGVQEQV